jgi:ribonuclease HI
MYTIYVDAGFKENSGHISWYNKTTDKTFYEKRMCKDSFICEYEAIIKALEDHKDIIENNEVEILMDGRTVADQLNRKAALNRDDIREMAMKVWGLTSGKKVRFQWIPRKQNLAGKMLGS